jgi:acetyl esterase/lipase
MKYFIIILFLCVSGAVNAQDFMPIWPKGKMPNTKGMKLTDSIGNERIYRVGTPGMYVFLPSVQENRGAAILICPGGGYERLAYMVSGFQLAKWFNTLGISAFVLNYRLPNSADLKERYKGPLQDAQRAMKVIRNNATAWGIKPDRIGVQGSSAGGHLAATLGTFTEDQSAIGDSLDKQPFRPDFIVLVSPVIDLATYPHKGSKNNLLGPDPDSSLIKKYSLQTQVTDKTPPTFLVHASNDQSVDPRNSLLFYQALLEKKVSASLHIFPQGGHAIAVRNNPGSADEWTTLCEKWLLEMNFMAPVMAK